jgi:hypothetical protein
MAIFYFFHPSHGVDGALAPGGYAMNTGVHPLRVLVKALILFFIANLAYASINPSLTISAYNVVLPGRARLPFGGQPLPYSVMVDNLDIMMASHTISSEKRPSEFRVLLIGDSSVWQEDVATPDMFSEFWNQQGLQCRGRQMRFYNLGYPHPSIVKDLVVMDAALATNPDLVLWFITTNTIMPRRVNPFILANSQRTLKILDEYDLSLTGEDELRTNANSLMDKTIIGRRSLLARWLKLQAMGLVWSATGLDYSSADVSDSPPPANDVSDSLAYMGMQEEIEYSDKLLFNALRAGHDLAETTPVLIVNEPIFIASGENSDIRYNETYPRWAYDQYRLALAEEVFKNDWLYIDLWDAVPPENFSTTLHLTVEGGRIMTDLLTPVILDTFCN